MPDITHDYWNSEAKRYHGASKRPPAEARKCGDVHRQRYLRQLRKVANHGFGTQYFLPAYENWQTIRQTETGNPKALNWTNQQVRPEVTVIIGLLQNLHLENTGKEVSRAEVLNALVAEGLPNLLRHRGNFTQLPEVQHNTKSEKEIA
ncbi:hypothetical protein [Sulfitobacter sp.]|jgi:hypothetical protein|uniref:hypothetical protein n=1 Tax=Sulfitobacter sp. TaxID=1903071 RepID=UPI0039E5906A